MNSLDVKRIFQCVTVVVAVCFAKKVSLRSTVSRHGYPVEIHNVTTEDGYVLGIVRIPKQGHTPVLLVHGVLSSSADWCVLGNNSLAFRLFDADFDVWLLNARGNTFSRRHATLSPDKERFWDFSWHEIGMFDLPAVIDYSLGMTGFKSLHYAGHSQGTTSFFVMTSSRQEYDRKIKTAHLLAPVAYMYNTYSPPTRLLIPMTKELGVVGRGLGMWEILGRSENFVVDGLQDSIPPELFMFVAYALCGQREPQFKATQIRQIMETFPAGAALKQLEHYSQLISTGRFQQFDYGAKGNRKRYGASKPPSYRVERIKAPLALYYSDNDWFVALKDIELLKKKLKSVLLDYHVPVPQFNHIDFLYDEYAYKLYDEIIRVMKDSEKQEY
ncbi:lipase 3-like [Wyeomyia smithii]|uniref:lipase 3-like n=1 Tax=Wyeomyia smithii TaxID=174621 RepID=UPI00246815DB|nr:lipase 3-like [Wyeomyia smithii]